MVLGSAADDDGDANDERAGRECHHDRAAESDAGAVHVHKFPRGQVQLTSSLHHRGVESLAQYTFLQLLNLLQLIIYQHAESPGHTRGALRGDPLPSNQSITSSICGARQQDLLRILHTSAI